MKLEYRKLSDEEVASELQLRSEWSLENDQLVRQFSWKTYKDGLVFASAVGYLADRLNHHPDILIRYAKIRVAMNTHDVGGLSPFDFELARQIDEITV